MMFSRKRSWSTLSVSSLAEEVLGEDRPPLRLEFWGRSATVVFQVAEDFPLPVFWWGFIMNLKEHESSIRAELLSSMKNFDANFSGDARSLRYVSHHGFRVGGLYEPPREVNVWDFFTKQESRARAVAADSRYRKFVGIAELTSDNHRA